MLHTLTIVVRCASHGGPMARAASPGGNGLLTFTENYRIFSLDMETGATVEIPSAFGAAWSPDGTRLLLSTIPVLELAGRLEITKVEDPDWSPLGDRIAFTGYWGEFPEGSYDVFTVAPDGSDLKRLTWDADSDDAPGPSFDPEWSPDGTMIAFSRYWKAPDAASTRQIWVMNADGSDQRLLMKDEAPLEGPVWSPDGTMIAFNVGNGDLVRIMNADGTGVWDVIDTDGNLFVVD